MNEKKQLWKGIVIGAVLTLVLVEAAVWGSKLLDKAQHLSLGSPKADLTNERIETKLDEIESLMNEYYLEEINPEQVEAFLYKGAMAGLGDVYAAYYTAEEYEDLRASTNGSYCGIGVEVTLDPDTGAAKILRVFEGTPAMEAGILPGDMICKIGGKNVIGEDLTKVTSMLKGKEHTWVHISVLREGEEEYLEFDMELRTIELISVESEMLEGQIGYIAISTFDDMTEKQFVNALDDLESRGMKGLIVDLRDNSGGVVSSVCGILDRILPEGLIVYTEDKYGNREEEYSNGKDYLDKPLAVLVNENSASASEIFAGAVKDYKAGTLIGTKTFGKGIVQGLFGLDDGSALKLTVSKYYTPKGNNIHGIGIEPDVWVEIEKSSGNQDKNLQKEDEQLEKAVEILNKQI